MIGDMESKSIFFFSFNLQSHENNLIHLIKDVLIIFILFLQLFYILKKISVRIKYPKDAINSVNIYKYAYIRPHLRSFK